MKSALNNAHILITRPIRQANSLCNLIEAQGGVSVRFPALVIEAVEIDSEVLLNAFAGDWLIFTSANAVDFALQAFGGKMGGLHKPRIAAVGQATARALQNAGWVVDCMPVSDFSSEGLLAEELLQNVEGMRCVIVRGVGGREILAETLRIRGAEISYLEVYRRCRPNIDTCELVEQLQEYKLGVVTITSAETLQNLLDMLDRDSVNLLRAVPLVVASDRIGRLAVQLGFKQIAVSRQPTDEAILETLTTLLNGENSGRSN